MSTAQGPRSPSPIGRLVVAGRPWVRQPLAWFRLGPAERSLVELERRVGPGDPMLQRVREPRLVEVRLPEGVDAPAARAHFDGD